MFNSGKIDIEQKLTALGIHMIDKGTNDEFRQLAHETASALKPTQIEKLAHYLHNPPKQPEKYSFDQLGLGGWMSVCQFCIFETWFQKGTSSLPIIRKFAWGEYDWSQGNAIELLIRFAAKGVETEAIIEEIVQKFPDIRYEAQLYSIQPLLPDIDADSALADLFHRLRQEIPDFEDSYQELME
ncbi:hypothetical protein [Erythrobacter sp.]|uniref:hypothetical protein n=1 Tax=Sphingomonadales TaxID=204457 RepID=UPI0032644ABF